MARWLRTIETTTSDKPVTEPGRFTEAMCEIVDALVIGPALWAMKLTRRRDER